MQKVTFLSRSQAQAFRPTTHSALISISDRRDEPLQPQPGWRDVLHLSFDDADVAATGVELMTEQQARDVLAFVRRNRDDCAELVVHCLAGQSRSAAVALFCAEVLLEGVPCFKAGLPVTTMRYPLLNRKVFTTLLRVLHDEDQRAET